MISIRKIFALSILSLIPLQTNHTYGQEPPKKPSPDVAINTPTGTTIKPILTNTPSNEISTLRARIQELEAQLERIKEENKYVDFYRKMAPNTVTLDLFPGKPGGDSAGSIIELNGIGNASLHVLIVFLKITHKLQAMTMPAP